MSYRYYRIPRPAGYYRIRQALADEDDAGHQDIYAMCQIHRRLAYASICILGKVSSGVHIFGR